MVLFMVAFKFDLAAAWITMERLAQRIQLQLLEYIHFHLYTYYVLYSINFQAFLCTKSKPPQGTQG